MGHGQVGPGSGHEGVTEETETVDGEEAEVEAFQEGERIEEIPKHGEGQIGDEKHVTEAESFGENGTDVRLEAEAEVLSDEQRVDVAERGIKERPTMDSCHDGGHVAVRDVHDDGVVQKAETPRPGVAGRRVDLRREIDEETGDEEEREVEERQVSGEAGSADEAEPGDEYKQLEDEFVGEQAHALGRKSRDSAGLKVFATHGE
jgi:hypothetical protein